MYRTSWPCLLIGCCRCAALLLVIGQCTRGAPANHISPQGHSWSPGALAPPIRVQNSILATARFYRSTRATLEKICVVF